MNEFEHQLLINSGRVLKQCYLLNNMDADINNSNINMVFNVVITFNYCKCMLLLYSPLNSYLYVHWILDFK